jgi:hypothetical protein
MWVSAGTYGGRFIHGMDRRITNRNLCVFGALLADDKTHAQSQ